MTDSPLLQVKELNIKAGKLPLVQNLSFELFEGKTLGIVGESGSGKSLTSLAIMGLLPKSLTVSGKIIYTKRNLLEMQEDAYSALRGKDIAMIFQEPMTALNPTMKCGKQVMEIMLRHLKIGKEEAKTRTLELFNKVDLPRPEVIIDSYPHQISGGQKQRVMIAMAIACKPKILIADEPTTALDATVQQGILTLLNDLRDEYGMGMIFISHDLGVVKNVADDILVMYKGETMEYGKSEEVFHQPKNPYTRGLLACKPSPGTSFERLPVVSDFLDGNRPKLKLQTKEGRAHKLEELLKQKPLLSIKDVNKYFKGKSGMFAKSNTVTALDKVELKIYPGETLGLVGESGSGKTTLGRILCGLEKASTGSVFYKEKDISKATTSDWRTLHRDIQIIFQDPFSALNPRIKIGDAIVEAMGLRKDIKTKDRKAEARSLLVKVGLTAEQYNRYPHEFSGGQRQRIGIARALAVQPKFIVCDESVSALDVSVQAQVLNLLNDLKDEFNFTYLFISHDLSVVKYFSDRIVVLKDGQLVEEGAADALYDNPQTEYTKKLIASTFN
ncbi:ABC transporter ATP-binding protein [Owenweeksia hongkongensis]|uniref:ABC transporter ATP-binding protein n=1 Tax=Owenweeksia hongkongensis TaxID=253245 RepID=UPI003A95B8AB